MIRAIHSFCALAIFFSLTAAQAATVEFSGGTTPETIPTTSDGPWGPDKPVVVGVFADNFDPLRPPWPPGDICRYGDALCNLESDYYVRMVADKNFIPLGEARTFGLGTFMGTAVANGIGGRQLWMVLEDGALIATALGNPNWLGASDFPGSDLNNIDLADVNIVIFGELQDGRVSFSPGLPIPEPSTWTLFSVGILVVSWRASRTKLGISASVADALHQLRCCDAIDLRAMTVPVGVLPS